MSSSLKPKRRYTITQKQQILKEHLEHGLSISAISRNGAFVPNFKRRDEIILRPGWW